MVNGILLGVFGLGGPEMLLIMAVILVFFGGSKIPELAKGLGKGIREFKDAANPDSDKDKTLADKSADKKD
jgi:sec-independent protein translocase protein TatA